MRRTNTAVWLPKYNRWQIKVQKDGERRTFTSSTPGRTGQRECNAKADAWLESSVSPTRQRVEDLFDGYIDDLKSRTSQSHWRPELSRGDNWIKPIIGHLKIEKLTDQHLQSIINAANSKGLSKKSLKNLRKTLFAFCKYCRKCKAAALYPEDVVIPNAAPTREKVILQPDHIVKLFGSSLTTFRGKPVEDDLINAYRFQTLTGLRPGEILGLKWSDIVGDTVNIKRSINVLGEVTAGKNENAVRSFRLNDISRSVIQAQRQMIDGSYVFPRVSEQLYNERLKRYCRANGIPEVTAYELRHTFVSIVQSLPESEVKAVVGHSQSMDTFGVYGHKTEGWDDKIAQNIQAVFSKITQGTV